MTWGDDLAAWWIGEVESDAAYREEVLPLALELAEARSGELWLDLGCGEGRVMRALRDAGAEPIGCELSEELARRAIRTGPVVVSRLPALDWAADGTFDGALAVLVLEHLADPQRLLEEAARVVRPGGVFALVANHPVMTAPGSAPVVDREDGEVLWRWGDYPGTGVTREPAGSGEVLFHHRALGDLLTAAAAAGWSLRRLVERGVGAGQVSRDPLLAMQRGVPRLLGVRWTTG